MRVKSRALKHLEKTVERKTKNTPEVSRRADLIFVFRLVCLVCVYKVGWYSSHLICGSSCERQGWGSTALKAGAGVS